MIGNALVVDDSKAVRMILSRILKEVGYEVHEAADAREAWGVIEVEKSALTLILLDWNMPEVNGLELLKQIRKKAELASTRVVMVTTETELDHMMSALEAGANEYVMKPFTKEIILEKLQLAGVSL